MKPDLRPRLAVASVALVVACRPGLPDRAGRAPDVGDADVVLDFIPDADPAAAPRVLWLRVSSGSDVLDPARASFFAGEIGPGHLRQIEDGDLSDALEERVLPARAWLDADGAVLLAPSFVLEAGETYSIALAAPPVAWGLEVSEVDHIPLAPRVWPPASASATDTLGVWCGPEPLVVAALPDDPAGLWSPGAIEGVGSHCLRFDLEPDGHPATWAAPPLLALASGGAVRLDPRPLARDLDAPLPEAAVPPCAREELRFGPGCATVADDRLVARAGGAALLWAIGGAGVDQAGAVGAGAAFPVWPLVPESSIHLDVATLDAGGAWSTTAFHATTKPPMAHVVISEVLANPNGPEPDQEWIELVNDGLVAARLEGWVLVDGGGETTLPAATLEPGARALLVNDSFVADGAFDPPPHPSAVILRVSKLGKNGLSNQGEPVALHADHGALVSAFPAFPKPSAPGVSICRSTPKAPDGDPASFAKNDPPTPGAP